jgi:hypothetical protein
MLDLNWSKIAESFIVMAGGGSVVWVFAKLTKLMRDMDVAFEMIRANKETLNGRRPEPDTRKRDAAVEVKDPVGVCHRGDCPLLTSGWSGDSG